MWQRVDSLRDSRHVYLVAILVASFLIPLLLIGHKDWLSTYIGVSMVVASLLNLVLSWRIYRLHRDTGFRLIGMYAFLTFAFWTGAWLTYSMYAITSGIIPMPSLGDLFAIGGYVPLFFALTWTVYSYKHFVTRADLLKAGVSWGIIMILLSFYLTYFTKISTIGLPAMIVNFLYPIFDSMLLFLLFLLLLMYRRARMETYWLIITLGIFTNMVGDILYIFYEAFDTYYVGSLADSFIILALLIIAFGFNQILRSKTIYFEIVPIAERKDTTLPRFTIEPSAAYLFEEEQPIKCFEVFCDLVTHGVPGLCLTRLYPPNVRVKWALKKTPLLWLSNVETLETVSPIDLNKLIYIVSEFLRRTEDSVILLEGVEYLITQNDFLSVLRMIHAFSDLVVMHNSRLIITLDPSILEERERALVEKGMIIFKEKETS